MQRRQFIEKLGLGSLAGFTMLQSAPAQSCSETTRDLYGMGPFHLNDIPLNHELAPEGEAGEKIKISGTLTESDCTTPISDATLEVWQADDAGCYHHPNSCGAGEDFHLYGKLTTGSAGNYEFTSILPGRYLNGSLYRPRHIHFQITTADGRVLVTQLYFEGDEFIPSDLGASDPTATNRIIPMVEDGDYLAGDFNITMAPSLSKREAKIAEIRNNTSLRITALGEVLVFDSPHFKTGKKGSLIIHDLKGSQIQNFGPLSEKFGISKNTLNNGIYRATIQFGKFTAERIFYVAR